MEFTAYQEDLTMNNPIAWYRGKHPKAGLLTDSREHQEEKWSKRFIYVAGL